MSYDFEKGNTTKVTLQLKEIPNYDGNYFSPALYSNFFFFFLKKKKDFAFMSVLFSPLPKKKHHQL